MVRTHLHAACSLDIEFSFQHRFPSLTPYVFRQFSFTTCCLTSLPSALQVIHMMHIHSVEIILLMLNLDRTAPCIWALSRAAQQHSPFPLTRLLWCTQTFVLSTNWMLVCKWISFSNRLLAQLAASRVVAANAATTRDMSVRLTSALFPSRFQPAPTTFSENVYVIFGLWNRVMSTFPRPSGLFDTFIVPQLLLASLIQLIFYLNVAKQSLT